MTYPIIPGDGITLRPITESDLAYTLALRNMNQESFFSGAFTWNQHVAWFEQNQLRNDSIVWIIESPDRRRLGQISLYGICEVDAELGRMMIDTAERRHGYAAKAVNTVSRYAFETRQLSEVWLDVFAKNAPALALYLKCGFVEVGQWTTSDGQAVIKMRRHAPL